MCYTACRLRRVPESILFRVWGGDIGLQVNPRTTNKPCLRFLGHRRQHFDTLTRAFSNVISATRDIAYLLCVDWEMSVSIG